MSPTRIDSDEAGGSSAPLVGATMTGRCGRTTRRGKATTMRVWTIAEVLQAPPGTPVEAVSGTLATITSFTYGENEYGPWTLQNVWITDGTGKLKVKLCDHRELGADCANHKVWIIAGTGKRGGAIGLKTEVDNHKGARSIMLKANNSASLSWTEPAGVTTAAPASQQQQAPPPPQQPPPPPKAPPYQPPIGAQHPPQATQDPGPFTPPSQTQAPPPSQAASAPAGPLTNEQRRAKWAKFDAAVNKLRRMRLRTLMVAHRIAEDAKKMGINVDAQHIEKIDSWVAIECCRNGLVIDIPDCDPPTPTQQTGGPADAGGN